MTDKEFIAFLLDLLNTKIHKQYIHDDAWLLLTREMEDRGYNSREYFEQFVFENPGYVYLEVKDKPM